MKLWIALALAGAVATPAAADVTATFASTSGAAAATAEIAQNGDGRMNLGPMSFFKRGDRFFVVITKNGRPIVIDLASVAAEMRQSTPKTGTDMCGAFQSMSGNVKMVQIGTATVRGRTGDAWFKQGGDGRLPDKPELVISHDPALAPLGAFLAAQYRASTSMMPDCPALKAITAPVQAALDGGTAIMLNGLELSEVRQGPVAAKRFELPAPPMSVDEMRKNGP
jgi:hypothetical protein